MRILICMTLIACLVLAGCGGPSSLSTNQSSSDFGDISSSFGTQQSRSTGTGSAPSIWDMQALKAKPNVELAGESVDHNVQIQELYYESPASGGNMLKIFAYYGYPLAKKGQKLPAVVIVDSKTGSANKEAVIEWASRGYAAFSMDLSGKVSGQEKSSPQSGISEAAIFETQPSPKNSFLFPAVNSVCRGISVLSGRSEVDKSRIGMIGSGWGGVITLIANGIDTRITAACSTGGAGYIDEKPDHRDWRKYYDPSSYLTNLHGRTLFVGATGDAFCSLHSLMRTYDAAQCEKTLCLMPDSSSELGNAAKGTIVKWFDWALRSGPALPKIKLAKNKGSLAVTAKGGNAVTEVKLFTADSSDLAKAAWKSSEMKNKDGVWITDQPSANASYFIMAKDDTGALVSAELHLPNDGKTLARKPGGPKPEKKH